MSEVNSGFKSNMAFNNKVEANTDFMDDLRQKLPEFFNGDGFDLKKFESCIKKNNPNELTSGYRLDFIGKDYAKRQAGQRPTSVIVSDEAHNAQDKNRNSKNLFLTGDNLEVLRHLRQNYSTSVDFIYIDPPYNTGSDGFVYPDAFQITDEMLLEYGVDITDNKEVRSFKERYDQQGKKSHSAWLSFMYPRLVLARKLLKEDGVIFVSIDDNEQANLKLVLDDIFGEINFLNRFTWVSKPEGRSLDSIGARGTTEVIYAYSKNAALHGRAFTDSLENLAKLMPDDYKINKNVSEDAKGPYIATHELHNGNSAFNEETRPNLVFDMWYNSETNDVTFEDPNDESYTLIKPHRNKDGVHKFHAYRWSKEKILNEKDDLLFVSSGDSFKVFTKRRDFNDVQIKDLIKGISTVRGSEDLKKLGMNFFSFPKPVALIKLLLESATKKDDVVLDFFAGSATTAQAVMELNREDGGKRQFMMVQIPEPLDEKSSAFKAGFKTIDEISRARIEKSAEQVGDTLGYKHFTIQENTANVLDKMEEFNPHAIIADDMLSDIPGGVDTLLNTWMVADGYKFNEPVEIKKFDRGVGYYVDNSVLYILESNWDSMSTKELLNQLGKHKFNLNTIIVNEYALTFETMTELKTNIQILKDKDFDIQIEVRN